MASRFWVGGTGTWDSTTTTHWSASTGGAGGATAPVNGDTITFDGSSGGGTVTVDTTINGLSFAVFTMGAFTGTIDFSANNPSITFTGFSNSGTGTRTLNLGSGTFSIVNGAATPWDMTTTTNLTFNAGTSTISISGTASLGRTIAFGSTTLTYATVTLSSLSNGTQTFIVPASAATITIGTLNLGAPGYYGFSGLRTLTITNAFNWTGTASNSAIYLSSSNAVNAATISVASGSPTIAWGVMNLMTFSGGATFTATNSFDLKGNTGITITGPSGGSSGKFIGG